MFQPPRCPYRSCLAHRSPAPGFFERYGSYEAKCRPRRIPRYRCKRCDRTFSRQTFRADYRDHRPALNVPLLKLLASGIGLRQSSRILGLSLRCTELKFRKLARHLRRLNLNLQRTLPPGAILQMDEIETFEARRNTRPLSVPVLIERDTRFVIWAESAPIRPRGTMTEKRILAIEQEERRFGPRRDTSARSVRRTLKRGADLLERGATVHFETDEKSTYPRIARRAFERRRIVHNKTNSKLSRETWNPLFPINHTEAMMRDTTGRLRRRSWLASKKRRYLDLGLHVWIAFRNLVRKRFNFDEESPAQLLGQVDRRLTFGELIRWRQDWGKSSIHPFSRTGRSVSSGNIALPV